ncbi:MAG: hypothetical protein N5P05_001035 [Chroococcopsis gigantea SAG 12.99]|nr:hypothetical protein [Chlorogloea purpurea SAG 13.99]MDV2999429.1 hypothetical protein [Chroococcopsis gigantea SAG 12.99]
MPTDDRKRRILDHLSQSAKGATYVPKTTSPTPVAPVTSDPVTSPQAPKPTVSSPSPTPVSSQNRKRRILDHLSLSSKEFSEISSKSEEDKRKSQIQAHIKKSQG